MKKILGGRKEKKREVKENYPPGMGIAKAVEPCYIDALEIIG